MILLITTNAPSPPSSRPTLERRSLREASRSEAPSREGRASSSAAFRHPGAAEGHRHRAKTKDVATDIIHAGFLHGRIAIYQGARDGRRVAFKACRGSSTTPGRAPRTALRPSRYGVIAIAMARLSISVERGPPQQINKPQCVGEPLYLLFCSVPALHSSPLLTLPPSLSLLRRARTNGGPTPPFFRPSPALNGSSTVFRLATSLSYALYADIPTFSRNQRTQGTFFYHSLHWRRAQRLLLCRERVFTPPSLLIAFVSFLYAFATLLTLFILLFSTVFSPLRSFSGAQQAICRQRTRLRPAQSFLITLGRSEEV